MTQPSYSIDSLNKEECLYKAAMDEEQQPTLTAKAWCSGYPASFYPADEQPKVNVNRQDGTSNTIMLMVPIKVSKWIG